MVNLTASLGLSIHRFVKEVRRSEGGGLVRQRLLLQTSAAHEHISAVEHGQEHKRKFSFVLPQTVEAIMASPSALFNRDSSSHEHALRGRTPLRPLGERRLST